MMQQYFWQFHPFILFHSAELRTAGYPPSLTDLCHTVMMECSLSGSEYMYMTCFMRRTVTAQEDL